MSDTAPPVSPPEPLRPSLDPAELGELTRKAVSRADTHHWSIDELPWTALRPEELTETDRSVVRFITFIEDHIPGYLTYFLDAFPVSGEDLAIEEFCFNREYFRFLISWANEEERHASVLTRYQIEAGISDPDTLLRELAEEGRKKFSLPYESPVQAFTYTLVQEKATQLFYQRFKAIATEPVLRELLHRLARDEARHFAFYTEILTAYITRHGLAATIPDLKDVLSTFRMPLADTLNGYWRWSLRVADTVSYNHTEAYGALIRLVNNFSTTKGGASTADLAEFIHRIRAV
ncbi:putative acyl-(acyl-carrier protein) desaturase [Streptomyces bingchenggensis BCW-1]|uniref:Putative acyl-(Acyl-carrier protein) desaturase n=1 Tax=Streptomyces bingchenggensis (strain BCW-1) TaxID=749414 RepID=D7C2I1_STRBB|nr:MULTISPECIES: acyl-ACP desaturase [Streptomyces]ADI03835.1 putative acyl-(acyl-carrier protein) desaturase [Streptomyces bingchenggensis BCW-1]